jgi:hypothetical protein
LWILTTFLKHQGLIYIKEDNSILALVPGHLILKPSVLMSMNHPEGLRRVQELHVISHDALNPHFRRTNIGVDGSEEFTPVSPDQLPKLLTLSRDDVSITGMSVHASPLCADIYRVWLCGTNYSNNEPFVAAAQLCIASGQWRRDPYLSFTNGRTHPKYTYAGHSLSWSDGKHYIRSVSAPSKRSEVDIEERAESVNITPYSGALTYLKGPPLAPTIVIKYYK